MEERLHDYFFNREFTKDLWTPRASIEEIKRSPVFVTEPEWIKLARHLSEYPNEKMATALNFCRLPYSTMWLEHSQFEDTAEELKESGFLSHGARGMFFRPLPGDQDLHGKQFILDVFNNFEENGKMYFEGLPLSVLVSVDENQSYGQFLDQTLEDWQWNILFAPGRRQVHPAWAEIASVGTQSFADLFNFILTEDGAVRLQYKRDHNGKDPIYQKLIKRFCLIPNKDWKEFWIDKHSQWGAWTENQNVYSELCTNAAILGSQVRLTLAAIAVLNSKNIAGAEKVDRSAENVARRAAGQPRVGDTYHLLKVKFSKALAKGLEEQEQAEKKEPHTGTKRAHTVRMFPRMTKRGIIFVTEHWRGNPNLGWVHKDYDLDP